MANASSTGTDKARTAPLESIVDEAISLADEGRITFKNLLDAWGDRSYGPLFIILGFIAGTPLAVVPFAAALIGLIIAGLAVQMIFGRAHPWVPRWVRERSVSEKKLKGLRDKAGPVLSFIDNLITERLRWASGPVPRRIAAAAVFVLGLAMAPLDMAPMLVAAPAWAVVMFGVAITARDGLFMILAALLTASVAYLGVQAF